MAILSGLRWVQFESRPELTASPTRLGPLCRQVAVDYRGLRATLFTLQSLLDGVSPNPDLCTRLSDCLRQGMESVQRSTTQLRRGPWHSQSLASIRNRSEVLSDAVAAMRAESWAEFIQVSSRPVWSDPVFRMRAIEMLEAVEEDVIQIGELLTAVEHELEVHQRAKWQ